MRWTRESDNLPKPNGFTRWEILFWAVLVPPWVLGLMTSLSFLLMVLGNLVWSD